MSTSHEETTILTCTFCGLKDKNVTDRSLAEYPTVKTYYCEDAGACLYRYGVKKRHAGDDYEKFWRDEWLMRDF